MSAMPVERQLDSFLARFDPATEAVARDARARLKKRLPSSVEMIYDNYNALVLGFGATDKVSEAVLSLAVFPNWVTLCFLWGVALDDPLGLLKGDGNQVRHIRLSSAEEIDRAGVAALIDQAVSNSKTPFPAAMPVTIVKSISAKQRPRRVDSPKATRKR